MKNAMGSADQDAHVINTVAPLVVLENGKPALSFYFSSALSEKSEGLHEVIAFAKQVSETRSGEVTLSINVGLEDIMDATLDDLVYPISPRDGKLHMSDDYKGQIDLFKESLKKALDKLENVQFHSEPPKSGDA